MILLCCTVSIKDCYEVHYFGDMYAENAPQSFLQKGSYTRKLIPVLTKFLVSSSNAYVVASSSHPLFYMIYCHLRTLLVAGVFLITFPPRT